MFPKKPTDKQVIGRVGEDFSCEYLKKNGFKIIDRNYLRRWGEIDIVAKKGNILHFVEVKTVSRDTFYENKANNRQDVTHETDGYRPEDNIHPWKLQRMSRIIQSYLLDKDVSDETDWQFDVITVYLDRYKKLIKIEILDDIVL
jgi:putative endonuclease